MFIKPRKKIRRPGDYSSYVPRIPGERKQICVRLSKELIDFAEQEAYLRSSKPPFNPVTLSDIVRESLILLRDKASTKVELKEQKDPCSFIEEGSNTFCSTCGISWNSEFIFLKPKCPLKDLK